jgi:choline kinase
MNFIIIGDKFQKRMKSQGCVGLINIKNKPLLQHQYDNIKRFFPEANIVYIYGFQNKKFDNFINSHSIKNNITVIYNPDYEKYNHGYSLCLAKNFLNTECCILFGDNTLEPSVLKNFNNNNNSQVFINQKNQYSLGCILSNNKIDNIAYDLDKNYISNIYYLSSKHATLIQKMITNSKYYNYFMFEFINKLIDNNETILPFFIRGTLNEKNIISIKQ